MNSSLSRKPEHGKNIEDKLFEGLKHMLEKEGIYLPRQIFNSKLFKELEENIKDPYRASEFCKKVANNIIEYINKDGLSSFKKKCRRN